MKPRRTAEGAASPPLLSPLSVVFGFLLFLSLVEKCAARPNGAAGCAGGRAAVGGFHLSDFRPIVDGPLSLFGLEVAIDGEILSEEDGAPVPNLAAGEEHVITLTSAVEGGGMRGFLIRLEAPASVPASDVDLFPSSDNAKDAAPGVCQLPALGVTHRNSSPKRSTSAVMRIDEPTNGVILDVTVVIRNDFSLSEYYYTGFTINIVGAGAPPTAAPVAPPTTPAPMTREPTTREPTTREPTTSEPTAQEPTITPQPVSSPTMAPAVATNAPIIAVDMDPLCLKCQRLYKRLQKGGGASSANGCNNKCERLPGRNPRLYIPDAQKYCPGLCRAAGNERKADKACLHKTPFCAGP